MAEESQLNLNPIQLVISWFTYLEKITTKTVYAGMKDLFDKLPSYQKDRKGMYQDEIEMANIEPSVLVSTFKRLKDRKIITFDKTTKRYALNETEYSEQLSPHLEWVMIAPQDMDKYMTNCFDSMISGDMRKDDMIDAAEALKILWEAQKQGKVYAIVQSNVPFPKKDISAFNIGFSPRKFVSETRNYDTTYKFLQTSDLSFLNPEMKITPKTIESLAIPGLEVKLFSSEE
jgi:hypothetical protein